MSEVTVPPTRLLPLGPEKLLEAECWWRDHQEWLAERGYLLRHQYRPDWKPSWLAKKEPFLMEYEDWYRPQWGRWLHSSPKSSRAHNSCMNIILLTDKSRDWKGTAKHSTRTLHPVKYYFIDFGLSRRYDPKDDPPREHPILGGDKSVPGFQNWNGELLDPFPTDIYYLGNLIRIKIMKFYHGIEFLEPLVQDMVQDDPTKRPTIQDVIGQFDELVKPLGSQKLRSRLIYRKEGAGDALVRRIAHAFWTARYILTRKPAIPRPL
ncbi:hypothetical protein VTO73DRAFT_1768 [Trametes versicolor]